MATPSLESRWKAISRLDAIGAVATLTTLVALGLAPIGWTGIPSGAYAALALVAAFYAWNSYRAYLQPSGPAVVRIGLLNLVYAALAIGVLWSFRSQIQPLAAACFLLEMAIVVPLAIVEIRLGLARPEGDVR